MTTIASLTSPSESRIPEGGDSIPAVPFRMAVLPNGLTLIVHEDRRNPLVASQLRFNVGSRDEPPGRTGFAHLFEHLMFKASAHRRGNWHKMLQAMGGSGVNGTTSFDRTNYYQTVPTAALDQLLWMESDRMGHLLGGIDATTLADEVSVVKNEKRQREGVPYGGVTEAIATMLYPPEHPYGHTILGSFEDLDNANMETVAAWHARWYGASNAVLALVGDISFEDALAKVEHWFGAIPAGAPPQRVTRWVPEIRDTRRAVLYDAVPHAGHYAVWSTPPAADPESAILQLVARILGGDTHSRLARRLIEGDRLCLGIQAQQQRRGVCGEFHVMATVAPGVDSDAVAAAITDEIRIFLTEGPTREELDRVHQSNRAGVERMLDQLNDVAEILAGNMLMLGTPDGYRAQMAIVENASPEQVRDVAARWLGQQALALDVKPFTAVNAPKDPAERTVAPAMGTVHAPAFPTVETAVLDNGLELRVARRPGVRSVDFALVFDNGAQLDPRGLEGLSIVTLGALDAGTARRTKHDLSRFFQEMGIGYSVNVRKDMATMSMSTLKNGLADAMACMAELLLEPAFPEQELRLFLDRHVANARGRAVAPGNAAEMAVARLIYGPRHAYTPFTAGTAQSLSALTLDRIGERHRNWLDPRRARLVIAGDLTLDEAREFAERAFGQWTGKVDLAVPEPGPWEPAPGRYFIERPGHAQSALCIAMASPEIRFGREELTLFNSLFGGSFGSRLNANLRERKGWTYGAGSGFGINPLIGGFHIRTDVQADHTQDALAEVEAELRALSGARPVTHEEIETARHAMLIGLPGVWSTNVAVVNAMIEQIVYALPQDHHDHVEERIRAIGQEDVQAVADLVGDPSRYAWIVAGDGAFIDGAGHVSIDAEGNVQ